MGTTEVTKSEFDLRSELLSDMLEFTLSQQQRNASRGGSCWGCNANAALIALTHHVVCTHILSDDFSPEEDTAFVKRLIESELCIFTLETSRRESMSLRDIMYLMRDEAKKKALPVLEAFTGTSTENSALYKRLRSAADSAIRMAG